MYAPRYEEAFWPKGKKRPHDNKGSKYHTPSAITGMRPAKSRPDGASIVYILKHSRNDSSEIEDFLETHLCKLRGVLRFMNVEQGSI